MCIRKYLKCTKNYSAFKFFSTITSPAFLNKQVILLIRILRKLQANLHRIEPETIAQVAEKQKGKIILIT
jgi:hypothetical protein